MIPPRAVASRHVFLLSPARCDGARAKQLFNPLATFPLAVRLREPEGIELGEAFSFLSGLYFRGKLTYAEAFAGPQVSRPPVMIITTDRGLVSPRARVRLEDMLAFSTVDIGSGDPRFAEPLRRDALALDEQLEPEERVVLLGSIATGKYADTLLSVFGERLVFPGDFVGRGDMSRGGLLLRSARAGEELPYVPVQGAVRHGPRPPTLAPLKKW